MSVTLPILHLFPHPCIPSLPLHLHVYRSVRTSSEQFDEAARGSMKGSLTVNMAHALKQLDGLPLYFLPSPPVLPALLQRIHPPARSRGCL